MRVFEGIEMGVGVDLEHSRDIYVYIICSYGRLRPDEDFGTTKSLIPAKY